MIFDDGYYIGVRMMKFDFIVDNLLIMRFFGFWKMSYYYLRDDV